VTIRNSTFYNCPSNAVFIGWGTHDITVDRNLIYGCTDRGALIAAGIDHDELILDNQTYASNPNIVISNNKIHDCYVGIRLGSGGTIYNNVIWNQLGSRNGINLTNDDADSYPRVVYHNTVANTTSAETIVSVSGSPTITSANNIGPATAGTNRAYDATEFNINTDLGVFEPKRASAPINGGTDVTATVPLDIAGKSRTAFGVPDIGAFEFGTNYPRRP
jgi:hypothetical protein